MELAGNMKKKVIAYLALAISLLYLIDVSFTKRAEEPFLLSFMVPIIFVFFGMALLQKQWKGTLWLGFAFVAWYVISRIALHDKNLQNSRNVVYILSIFYLVAFPFAAVMDEKGKKWGLLLASSIGAIIFSATAWIGIIVTITGKEFIMPIVKSQIFVNEYGRLTAFVNPNNAACVFLLGIFCVGYLAFAIRKKWVILPTLVMGSGLWIGIALTVSRTVMLQCAAMLAAIVFVVIWHSPLRSVIIRVLVAFAAAILVFLLAYKSFVWTTEIAANSHANAETVQEVAVEETVEQAPAIKVRPLDKDLKNLTGRTAAWKGAFTLVRQRPKVLVLGMLDKSIKKELNRCIENSPYDFAHAHNAYIQVVLNMGLPGLCLALVFTWLTLRSAWNVLFAKRSSRTMGECWIALVGPVLLIASITEPFLFTERVNIPTCNFYFFLFLGYALQVERRIRAGNTQQENVKI